MSSRDNYNYSEDIFEETRMSFGDHIEDLRSHLLRAIVWLVIFVALSFFPFVGKNVLRFIAKPIEEALGDYWDKYYKERSRQVVEQLNQGTDQDLKSRNQPIPYKFRVRREAFFKQLGIPDPKGHAADPFDLNTVLEPLANNLEVGDWLVTPEGVDPNWIDLNGQMIDPLKTQAYMTRNHTVVSRRPALTTLNVQEAFMVYFKVCIVTGFVLASPMIFYQLWSFVAAGLYPHEKRYVHTYLPFSVGLFLAGVIVCEWLVIPKAIEALLWFNEWLGMEPDLRLNEWLGFAIFMPLLFGISFQTPLVMLFLERMGMVRVQTYRSARRINWFIMAVFAAVCSPSTDALSMLFLWVPMCFLYELGIWMCLWTPRRPELEIEVPEGEEMVEV
jgi:sec-independent protein translocase protein TatC